KVRIDGVAPGDDHGVDSNAEGAGEIREPRMYQLIRQKGSIQDRTFEIEFLDPGVLIFSFTFGSRLPVSVGHYLGSFVRLRVACPNDALTFNQIRIATKENTP